MTTLPVAQAAGTFINGTGAVVPGLPAGLAVGDVMLLFVETASEAVTAPSGWTATPSSPQDTGGVAAAVGTTRLSVFYKFAVAGETAPTVADPGNHAFASIVNVRGCIQAGSPFDTSGGATQAAATAISVAGVTTKTQNCLIVIGWATDRDANTTNTNMSGYTNSNLGSITEWVDNTGADGVGGGLAVMSGTKAAAGATGTTTATQAASVVTASVTLALLPLPDPVNITPVRQALVRAYYW